MPHGGSILTAEGVTTLDGDQLLELFVRGALGKAGRKRGRRAARFLGGNGGFLTASAMMAAVGVAWGLYDAASQPRAAAAAPGPVPPGPVPPGVPAGPPVLPPAIDRVVRLAVSAANADGTLSEVERAAILARAREAGVEVPTEEQLTGGAPLAEIVAGVSGADERRALYVLAFTIVRADEDVSGAERIYLAQLAHALGLDAATAASLERDTVRSIDQDGTGPA